MNELDKLIKEMENEHKLCFQDKNKLDIFNQKKNHYIELINNKINNQKDITEKAIEKINNIGIQNNRKFDKINKEKLFKKPVEKILEVNYDNDMQSKIIKIELNIIPRRFLYNYKISNVNVVNNHCSFNIDLSSIPKEHIYDNTIFDIYLLENTKKVYKFKLINDSLCQLIGIRTIL